MKRRWAAWRGERTRRGGNGDRRTERARADYAVSISGIAGPDGGSERSLSAPSGLLLPLPAVKALPAGMLQRRP